jgi:DNA-binding transcriptional ArsR family regulator
MDSNSSRECDPARGAATAPTLVDLVTFFKALGNPTRAQIVEFLLGGERCVCEMTGPLDVSQPLVSHHLALLREAGLVTMRKEGTRTYYAIDEARFEGDLDAFLVAVRQLRHPRDCELDGQAAC